MGCKVVHGPYRFGPVGLSEGDVSGGEDIFWPVHPGRLRGKPQYHDRDRAREQWVEEEPRFTGLVKILVDDPNSSLRPPDHS